MKETYRDTFIYKICDSLDVDIKELALLMGKTYKCIENWRKDDSSIPAKEKQYMKLLVRNKELESIIVSMQKHKMILTHIAKTNEKGESKIDINVLGCKRLSKYRIILEEV